MSLWDLCAFALAAFILINVLDRLRLVNWHMAKGHVVATLLLEFAIAAWALYRATTTGASWWLCLPLLAVLAHLHISRPAWRNGVPREARTDHAALDQAKVHQ